jgi:nucleoside-diphosphate-sugar epimerase
MRIVTKALITGGLGFIGFHLTRRLLEEGFEVHAVDNGERGIFDAGIEALIERWPRYRLIRGDLSKGDVYNELSDDYDLIFHLAAIVGVGNVARQPYRVLRDNITVIVQLLEWTRRQRNLQRFIFPSTSEVYAGTLKAFGIPIPTPECTPLTIAELGRPRTSYMLSKIYGEELCRHSGLPVTIVRPHNVYGPRMGMAHVIPELLQRSHQIPEGGSLTVYSPNHRRSFCYVDDALELMVRLATAPAAVGATFNVGSPDDEISIADLAVLIARTVGKHLEIVVGPDTEGSPARRCPDMTQATAVASYVPHVPLAEGLRRCYAWYRANMFETAASTPAMVRSQT